MYEDRPAKDTPDLLNRDLAEYGGLSPDGQPIWRMVLAQNCRIHCFGQRNEIERGRRAAMEQDEAVRTAAGLAVKETRLIEPDRIIDGEHWILRHAFKGWILQRWFPASTWGTRDNWESQKAKDGRKRLLAAYPNRGAYMMMAGPWPTIAQAGDLHGEKSAATTWTKKEPSSLGKPSSNHGSVRGTRAPASSRRLCRRDGSTASVRACACADQRESSSARI